MVERFPHPEGLLYFEPFWHLAPDGGRIHLAAGELRGEGPWKVGDRVVTIAGCAGTDRGIALELAEWQDYLKVCQGEYPPRDEILAVARRHGARV